MRMKRGISWRTRPSRRAAIVGICLVAGIVVSTGPSRADGTSGTSKVIVRLIPGTTATPDDVLAPVGGTLDRSLTVIDGFSATVPTANIAQLQTESAVLEVSDDAMLTAAPAETSPPVKGAKVSGFVDSDFSTKGGGLSFPRLDVTTVGKLINADDVRARG